jgi:hypothetical protein
MNCCANLASLFAQVTYQATLKMWMNDVTSFFGFCFSVFFLIHASLRLAAGDAPCNSPPQQNAEIICLVGCALTSFFYLTYFLKMHDTAGSFLILLEYMIVNDLSRW